METLRKREMDTGVHRGLLHGPGKVKYKVNKIKTKISPYQLNDLLYLLITAAPYVEIELSRLTLPPHDDKYPKMDLGGRGEDIVNP